VGSDGDGIAAALAIVGRSVNTAKLPVMLQQGPTSARV
jgi:hypothetical protein